MSSDRKNGISRRVPPPTAFIPHGGGPWPALELPVMDREEGRALADAMRAVANKPVEQPKFLVVVSAHWEATNVTVHTGPSPGMLYDYGGMPPEAYELQWPAPGDPQRGEHAYELLRAAGFTPAYETKRGYDHGTFIPLMLAYPKADIPVVQVSLKRGLDPAEHIALGRALAPLRDAGGYIIGSGNSYHNLPHFFRPTRRALDESESFDAWLGAAITSGPKERERLLVSWTDAPDARACHPREEHLIPLMVAVGAAGDDAGAIAWQGTTNGLRFSEHHFGETRTS